MSQQEHNIGGGMIENKFKRYLWNHLVLFSQFLSVILGGHPDISLCERIGNARRQYIGLPLTLGKVIIHLAYWGINTPFRVLFGQSNHIEDSLHGEPWCGSIWDWGPRKGNNNDGMD